MQSVLFINADAGTVRAQPDLPDAMAEALRSASCPGTRVDVVRTGKNTIVRDMEKLADLPQTTRIFLAGGDGTLSLGARTFRESGHVLGLLPLGTMNLAARSLGIPLDPLEACRALACGEPVPFDLGAANGVTFIHHVSLGVHPKLIRLRNAITHGSRFQKMMASLRTVPYVIRRPPRLRINVETEKGSRAWTTPGLIVSNNPFGPGHIPYADDPGSRCLGVYIAESSRWIDLSRAALDLMTGRLREETPIDIATARQVRISALAGDQRQGFRASIDGELVKFEDPIEISCIPAALSVLAPGEVGADRAA